MAAMLATGLMLLAGCDAPRTVSDVPKPKPAPVYGKIEADMLDGDLLNVIVTMSGTGQREDVDDYARCASAEAALKRGFGYARHIRTNLDEEGGIWRADAVYTVSQELPDGLEIIDTSALVADCAERKIPTV